MQYNSCFQHFKFYLSILHHLVYLYQVSKESSFIQLHIQLSLIFLAYQHMAALLWCLLAISDVTKAHDKLDEQTGVIP